MKKNLVGLGLRTEHFNFLLNEPATQIGWFEAITENFLDTGGAPLHVLERIRSKYPVSFHGVALSIGSTDGVRRSHLEKIKRLADQIEPFQVSDHFCFSRSGNRQFHELLPLPRTEAMAARVVRNITQVQEYLKRRLVLENISAYVEYPQNEMSDAEFINLVASKSGCGVLLDVNNVYVNATNFRFNARRAILEFDPRHVVQYHLAGFTDQGTHLFDTHAESVHGPVRQLFRETRFHLGERRFSIERDDHIPSFRRLERETAKIASLEPCPMPAHFQKKLRVANKVPVRSSRQSLRTENAWQRGIYAVQGLPGEISAGELSCRQARQVYRNAYRIRLSGSLRDKFTFLAAVMGKRLFQKLLADHLAQIPSGTEDLSQYGSSMPRFLHRLYPERAVFVEAARLDLMRHRLFHAAMNTESEISLSRRLALHGACLWQSPKAFLVADPAGQVTASARIRGTPQFALVYRDEFAVRLALLTAGQYRFTAKLKKPAYLSELLQWAAKSRLMTESETQALFAILGRRGVLCES